MQILKNSRDAIGMKFRNSRNLNMILLWKTRLNHKKMMHIYKLEVMKNKPMKSIIRPMHLIQIMSRPIELHKNYFQDKEDNICT